MILSYFLTLLSLHSRHKQTLKMLYHHAIFYNSYMEQSHTLQVLTGMKNFNKKQKPFSTINSIIQKFCNWLIKYNYYYVYIEFIGKYGISIFHENDIDICLIHSKYFKAFIWKKVNSLNSESRAKFKIIVKILIKSTNFILSLYNNIVRQNHYSLYYLVQIYYLSKLCATFFQTAIHIKNTLC